MVEHGALRRVAPRAAAQGVAAPLAKIAVHRFRESDHFEASITI